LCLQSWHLVPYLQGMKIDTLKQFSKLRDSLVAERSKLEKRLAQINGLLGVALASGGLGNGRGRGGFKGRRGRGGLSLKAAIIQATSAKPLTKEEILATVKRMGYKFSTKRPMATLNAYLYQKGAFIRRDGKFSAGRASN
jgi:hypothetical protein